jgi:hypothetical protein
MHETDRLKLLDTGEHHPYVPYCSDVKRRLIVSYHVGDGLSGEDLRRELCPDIPRLSPNDGATRDANFGVAKWLAWLSANVYIDDFGNIPYPGALFAIFADMGFGYDDEGQDWIDKGLELRKAIRDGYRDRKDALEAELFTQLPSNRGLGKLHATRIGSKYFNQGSTQVYFLHDRRRALAVVAFRGTQMNSRTDRRVDFDWKLVRYEDGKDIGRSTEDAGVFQGFRKALLENSDDRRKRDDREIRKILWDRLGCLPRGTRLYVTGHSLGGSLASLFTYATLVERMDPRPYSIVGLFTFGSPAVGNEPFARALNERMRMEGTYHARFVLGRDPVPRLHEHVWLHEINKWLKPIGTHRLDDFTKYRHSTELDCKQEVSQVIHLPCDGTKYTTYFREDQEVCCFNLPWYKYLSRRIQNHSMRRYFDAITECVKAGVSTQPYSS